MCSLIRFEYSLSVFRPDRRAGVTHFDHRYARIVVTNDLDLVSAVPGVKSRGEARRLVEGGGVSIGELRIEAWDQALPADAAGQVLKVGKRRIFRLVTPD